MKKLILTLVIALSGAGAFAQGELVFNNVTANAITNSVTGLRWVAGPDSHVAIYGASGNGQSEGSLVFQPLTMTNLFGAGLFQGNQRSTAIAVGPATLQIRAWSGAAYLSYEAAYAGGLGGDSSVLVGSSAPFNHILVANGTPGNPTGPAFSRFQVSPIPEPSSIALGLLGLGAIALFRRRK